MTRRGNPKEIASNAPMAVKFALTAVNKGLETSQDEGLLLEASYFWPLRRNRRQEGGHVRLPRKARTAIPRPLKKYSRRLWRQPMASDNIFSGLKVVDLASFIAGPSAAVILSDFGADVIKVEPPSGDIWRVGHKIPPQPQASDAYPWHLANRNKRGISVDLKSRALGRCSSAWLSGRTCSSLTHRILHASD